MNMEGECKILLLFSLTLCFECNRNGSSCTPRNTDVPKCFNSKRMERCGPSPVLCLHLDNIWRVPWDSSNEALLFLFHRMRLKGTFQYFRMISCPAEVNVEEPVGLWDWVSSLISFEFCGQS